MAAKDPSDGVTVKRIDENTLFVRARAEGPGGMKGDFAETVTRGSPGWDWYARLLEEREAEQQQS